MSYWIAALMECFLSNQISPAENERCFFLSDPELTSAVDCSSLHPVLCVDERLILVKQKKTWEEALHHCRKLPVAGNTKKSYNLASLPEHSDFRLDKKIGAEEVCFLQLSLAAH